MPKRNIRGWHVYGNGDQWEAFRFGVRMRANSESLVVEMIRLSCDKFTPWGISCQCSECHK